MSTALSPTTILLAVILLEAIPLSAFILAARLTDNPCVRQDAELGAYFYSVTSALFSALAFWGYTVSVSERSVTLVELATLVFSVIASLFWMIAVRESGKHLMSLRKEAA